MQDEAILDVAGVQAVLSDPNPEKSLVFMIGRNGKACGAMNQIHANIRIE